MADPGKPGGELTFFDDIGKDLEVTPEQQKAVEQLRKDGMKQEMNGLPIAFPKIEMLHQGTAAFRFAATEDILKDFLGIVIYVDASRVWWPDKFGASDGEGGFPKCHSRDLVAPDPKSEMVQAVSCGKCRQNEWGSAVNADGSQGRGKACKEVRRVFLLPAGHLIPHWMAVPPSSLKALGSYFTSIADKRIRTIHEVVTRFSLKTTENAGGVKYSELALEIRGAVPETVLAMIAQFKEQVRAMVGTAAPISKEDYEGRKEPAA